MGSITKFPGAGERRNRRNHKRGIVECQVSGRWLQFPENATAVGGKGFMFVDVMTLGTDEKVRKICELVLVKEDIVAMLAKIKVTE